VKVLLRGTAESDLEDAFDYYEAARAGLGAEFVTEFRRAVDQVIAHPRAWQPLDAVYRRCRLQRFPYGVIYGPDEKAGTITVVAIAHLNRDPDRWRRRLGL